MNTLDQVQAAVKVFVRAGDTNDVTLLDQILHSGFQNVQDGFFEENGIFVFSKEDYKALVGTKRFGGSPRTVEFNATEILGNLAHVKVRLESNFLIFKSTLLLSNDVDGWRVVHNVPTIERK